MAAHGELKGSSELVGSSGLGSSGLGPKLKGDGVCGLETLIKKSKVYGAVWGAKRPKGER